MAHLTTTQACESFPPIEVDYTAKGHWLEADKGLQGCKTYVSDPGESKKAILYIYDVGGFCPQTYQGADILASQGYHVYAPDIFKGDYMDLKLMPTLSDDEKDAYRTKFRAGAGNLEAQREPFRQMIAQLRAKGYDKVGAAGFCWGGNIVALTPELDAHGIIHPGAQTNADAAEKLEHPTCLLPSQNEDEETMEGFHAVMKKKPFGDKCVLKWYKDSPHGWCASRADLNSEKGYAAFKDAFEVLAAFFKAVL
ncbi:hypothetical protein JCM24511_02574 [Saitozyma sp. JCM 24511]|nr:hypothetical protein JCM24511_02574 [Saitozyma sp. JCM 24511]